jgi:hypothetical protein
MNAICLYQLLNTHLIRFSRIKPLKNFIAGVKSLILRCRIPISKWLSVIDSNGELTEIVISFIDITEMKLMQKEVIKAKYFAEKSKQS